MSVVPFAVNFAIVFTILAIKCLFQMNYAPSFSVYIQADGSEIKKIYCGGVYVWYNKP